MMHVLSIFTAIEKCNKPAEVLDFLQEAPTLNSTEIHGKSHVYVNLSLLIWQGDEVASNVVLE